MEISKVFTIGFWLGIAIISLLNIILLTVRHSVYRYDGYAFIVSFIILVFFLAVKIHLSKPRHHRR